MKARDVKATKERKRILDSGFSFSLNFLNCVPCFCRHCAWLIRDYSALPPLYFYILSLSILLTYEQTSKLTHCGV